jgi:hypothetical protein
MVTMRDQGSKALKLFDRSIQDVIIHRDVQFHEKSTPPDSFEPHVTFNLHVVDIVSNDAHIDEEVNISCTLLYFNDLSYSSKFPSIVHDTNNSCS